jgi:hypothetical protein
MTPLRILTICMTLMLLAGCASRGSAASGKDATAISTKSANEESFEKLRGAGFTQVIFAYKNSHGFYQRTRVPTRLPTRDAAIVPNITSEGSDRHCDSNRVAELVEAIITTNKSVYASYDFGESDILGILFNCADLPIKTSSGKTFFLTRPDYLSWISVSDLDRVLAKPELRKRLAVVFFESVSIWVKEGESFTTPEKFAAEIDQKLRGAGFKHVIFACKNNHGFYRRMWVPAKHP